MRVPSVDGVYYRIIGNVSLLDRRTSPQDRVEPMIFIFADISRILFWYLGGIGVYLNQKRLTIGDMWKG